MPADSEKPNIIGVIGRNIALWQNLWVGRGVGRFERRSSSTRASLALCGRFNQFRSPYSWITMRRALRKRRVFDFVPSYLNAELGGSGQKRNSLSTSPGRTRQENHTERPHTSEQSQTRKPPQHQWPFLSLLEGTEHTPLGATQENKTGACNFFFFYKRLQK